MHWPRNGLLGVVLAVAALWAAPACGYVDDAPSLGQVIKDATHIVVLRVDKVSRDKRVVIFQKVADLKGQTPAVAVKHHITDGLHPREPRLILDWAEPGKIAVCFHNGRTGQVCLGQYWYECGAVADDWWRMTRGLPEQALAYYGWASKLRGHVTAILAGKEVIITAVTHGAPGFRGYDAVAYKDLLRGKDYPLWRLRASLAMPRNVYHTATDPRWLAGLGAGSADDVPPLVKGLSDANARARADAADELGLIGKEARTALPALAKLLNDTDPLVRVSAAEALVRIDPPRDDAVAVLVAALKDKQASVRRAAAESLGNSGADAAAAVAALTTAVKDRDGDVRWAAVAALGRIGPKAGAAVPTLIEALADAGVAGMAADALGGIGADARPAIPALAKTAAGPDRAARWPAAVALVRIGGAGSAAAVPVLVETLKSDDARARWDALFLMQRLGPLARDATPAVVALLADDDDFMRELAAWTIGKIGPDARAATPALLPLLADDSEDIRLRAAVSLGAIGPAALPGLVKTLAHKTPAARYWAAYALERMGPQARAAVPALLLVLADDRDLDARGAAASALGEIGAAAKNTSGPLTAALKDAEPRVRILAAEALWKITRKPEPALAALGADLRQHKEPQYRREAAEALGRLGTASKAALPLLHEALRDDDTDVRVAASEALWLIDGNAEAATPILSAALRDTDADSRRHAAEVLGRLGAQGKGAVPVLIRALKDGDDGVRKAAAAALRKIDRQAAAAAGVPQPLADSQSVTMGIRILVVEDEANIADFLVRGLREEGFTVEHAGDGEEAWHAMQSGPWDAVLLDWWLPGADGLSLLRRYRQAGKETPVIFLTARDAVSDRVRGLDAGADDYLCKPFAFDELLARVRVLIRRRERHPGTLLEHADVHIDLATQRAERAGRPLDLKAKEQALLVFFLRHPGEVLSRTRIYEHVWDEHYDGTSNTLEVHLVELRRKLEVHGPRLIHTLRGRGYLFGAAPHPEAR